MKSRLDTIESRLQALIENGLTWLPWRSRQPRLAERVIEALRSQIVREAGLEQPAANIFNFFMHPNNAAAWLEHSEWREWLLNAANDMAHEAGVSYYAPLELYLKSDTELSTRELRLIATFPQQEVSSTAVMPTDNSSPEGANDQPNSVSAYLVLHGKEVFALDKPVINIGRRNDNHLVLDDMRVSRNHAQIRFVRSGFTLFDLNSTGGTFVNGRRVSQHNLSAGDVISFAGLALIYGEEPSAGKRNSGTSPASIHPKGSDNQ